MTGSNFEVRDECGCGSCQQTVWGAVRLGVHYVKVFVWLWTPCPQIYRDHGSLGCSLKQGGVGCTSLPMCRFAILCASYICRIFLIVLISIL